MPVLVFETPDVIAEPDEIIAKKASDNLIPPSISAKAVLVTDLDSGQIILDKNADEPLPIASLTKLMTGVVASEQIYLERTVRILPWMLSRSFSEGILSAKLLSPFLAGISFVAGDSYSAFDLLYPLLMQSSNEAASIIASFIGKDKFIAEMNRKAMSLVMDKTQFTDPSGRDNGNISTAKDLAKLARYILEKRKFLFDISKGKNYLTFGPINLGGLKNYNEFVENDKLIGVKNGQTKAAGQVLLTVWNFRGGENKTEKRIAVIVLGSEDRKKDTEILIDWLKNNFELQ
jgi:D-alanyl-D-alanine carboxypeptidase